KRLQTNKTKDGPMPVFGSSGCYRLFQVKYFSHRPDRLCLIEVERSLDHRRRNRVPSIAYLALRNEPKRLFHIVAFKAIEELIAVLENRIIAYACPGMLAHNFRPRVQMHPHVFLQTFLLDLPCPCEF